MSATCRSCGASILWAVTESGRRIPLDVGEREFGLRYLIDAQGVARRVLGSARGHAAHFTTCPDADKHRRAR